jgi:hypothetical protein
VVRRLVFVSALEELLAHNRRVASTVCLKRGLSDSWLRAFFV